MKVRWAIAIVGVLALAALTITTQMPWLTEPHPAMESTPAATPRDAANGAPSDVLSCPADAKPAKLDFALKNADGQEVNLASFKGKVLMLDFWATWCGPCKVEIPHFIEFQDTYGKQGLQIVGISIDDTPDKLQPYIRDMKMNYPVLQGLGRDDVQTAYGPEGGVGLLGIPVTVMISREGKVCATHIGLTGKDVIEREIQALL